MSAAGVHAANSFAAQNVNSALWPPALKYFVKKKRSYGQLPQLQLIQHAPAKTYLN